MLLSFKKFGAPRQNRTAITGLQNQCNAIILVGHVDYAFLRRWSIARCIFVRFFGLAVSNIFVSCATFSGPSLGLPL